MTREIAFVLRVWTCAVVAGGAIAALFFLLSGSVDGLLLALLILFFGATRGVFSLILFYIATYLINRYFYSNKYKLFLLAIIGMCICFTNIYLFLYRKKTDELFQFGPHLLIISGYVLAVGCAVFIFRKHLVKQETTNFIYH